MSRDQAGVKAARRGFGPPAFECAPALAAGHLVMLALGPRSA